MGRPVKVAFVGDVSDLEKATSKAEQAFDGVAAEAKAAGDKVDRSFAGVGEAADGVASASSQAAGGIGDLGGALSLIPGPLGLLGSGMEAAAPAIMGVTGAADLLNLSAEKFPKLAGAQAKATNVLAKAKRALGVAIRFAMGPFGLILAIGAAVALLFVTLYKRNEKFRAVVDRVMSAVGKVTSKVFGWLRDKVPPIFERVKAGAQAFADKFGNVKDRIAGAVATIRQKFEAIRTKVGDVVSGVRTKWNNLVDFVGGLPGRIASKARGMWDSIGRGFRGVINGIIGVWNNLSMTIDIPDAIPGLPGSWTLSTPNIPMLAQGGIVTRPTLAVIGEAGPEAVVPLDGRYGMGNTYVLKVTVAPTASPAEVGRQIVRSIEAFEAVGGRRRA